MDNTSIMGGMIKDTTPDKEKALLYVTYDDIPWVLIDRVCLCDKDVAVKYMETHSSNDLLHSGFPIDITQNGFLSDGEFITKVIQNLDAGYSKDDLDRLLKLSAAEIIKKRMKTMKYEDPKHYTDDPEYWKAWARMYLEDYANSVKNRNTELSEKVQILDEILNYEVPGLESAKKN